MKSAESPGGDSILAAAQERKGGILADPALVNETERQVCQPSWRLIDLTLTLRDGMRGVAFEQANTVERDGWNARTLHLYSHAGTHIDAQAHFAAGPGTIDQTPLERCVSWAWVVRLDGIADNTPITVAHLGDIAARFAPGESLLLHTGWSRHAGSPQHYRDNFPRIADDLARWCVEKRVNILGVEPPSVADVNNREELTRIHKILLGANVTIVEGLANLGALTHERVFFVAAPLKIEGGDGCPCRAFAIEDGSGGIPAAEPSGKAKQTSGRDAAAPNDPFANLVFLDHKEVDIHVNRLPHWGQDSGTYFVTFRLADSLPEELLEQWQAEHEAWNRANPPSWNKEQEAEYQKRFPARIEGWLDEGRGTCVLRRAECREIVAAVLRHSHGERHTVLSSVIMPNHVHVLFSLLPENRLEDVLHTWKSFTATEINRCLGQTGALWMKDYFDRSICNREHFAKVARYIRRNPEKAKLRAGEFTLWEGDLVADLLDRKGGSSGDARTSGIPAAFGSKSEEETSGRDAAAPMA